MKTREELKLDAKKALNGKILISFAITIIPALIAGVPSIFIPGFKDSQGGWPVFYSLASTIISIALMPMTTGLALYFLNVNYGSGDSFNNLFEPYKNGSAWEIIKAKLLSGIFIALGFILLIIPGIYLALKYAMIDYIIADKKDTKYDEAMKESGEIMQGNKGRLVILILSFIGWLFIVLITFGIAIVYVAPYIQCALAAFYNNIKKPVAREKVPIEQNQDIEDEKVLTDL